MHHACPYHFLHLLWIVLGNVESGPGSQRLVFWQVPNSIHWRLSLLWHMWSRHPHGDLGLKLDRMGRHLGLRLNPLPYPRSFHSVPRTFLLRKHNRLLASMRPLLGPVRSLRPHHCHWRLPFLRKRWCLRWVWKKNHGWRFHDLVGSRWQNQGTLHLTVCPVVLLQLLPHDWHAAFHLLYDAQIW